MKNNFLFRIALATGVVFVSATMTVAQTAAVDLIQKSALQYAAGYVNPVGNMLSAVFNSGQYHTAEVSGLHIYASLQVTGALVPDAEKTFSPSFYLQTDNNAALPLELRNKNLFISKKDVPTILGGDAGGAYLIDTIINNQHYQFGQLPPGINQSYIPLVVPHIEIGSFFNTELLLRGIPSVATNTKLGSIGFYGIGLRHSLSAYVPLLPVDVSVMVMYQHLNVGDAATLTAWNLAALVSRDLPLITVYAGVQLEQARLHLQYTFTDAALPLQPVDLIFNSSNNMRVTVGATIKLLILFINGQITIAPIKTIGLGVGLRIPPSLF